MAFPFINSRLRDLQLAMHDLSHVRSILFWVAGAGVALALIYAFARAFWRYRGMSTWPTADGTITRVEIRGFYVPDTGHTSYFANVGYDFHDTQGTRRWGQWQSRKFGTHDEASAFVEREMPEGKRVVVRFSPKDPMVNSLELDSWTYSGDRPLSLNS